MEWDILCLTWGGDDDNQTLVFIQVAPFAQGAQGAVATCAGGVLCFSDSVSMLHSRAPVVVTAHFSTVGE